MHWETPGKKITRKQIFIHWNTYHTPGIFFNLITKKIAICIAHLVGLVTCPAEKRGMIEIKFTFWRFYQSNRLIFVFHFFQFLQIGFYSKQETKFHASGIRLENWVLNNMAHATLRKLAALHWYIPIFTQQGRSCWYIVIGIFLCTPNNPIADNMHACVLTVRFGLIVVVTFDWVINLLVCYAPGGPGCMIDQY